MRPVSRPLSRASAASKPIIFTAPARPWLSSARRAPRDVDSLQAKMPSSSLWRVSTSSAAESAVSTVSWP